MGDKAGLIYYNRFFREQPNGLIEIDWLWDLYFWAKKPSEGFTTISSVENRWAVGLPPVSVLGLGGMGHSFERVHYPDNY